MDKKLMANVTRLATKSLDLEIKTRVLTDLLVRNGFVTHEEFKEMRDNVENAELPGTRNELNELLSDLSK